MTSEQQQEATSVVTDTGSQKSTASKKAKKTVAKRKPKKAPKKVASKSLKLKAEVMNKGKKRAYPTTAFEESIDFAKIIYTIGAGEKVRRLTLFDHLGKSPDSGPSRA